MLLLWNGVFVLLHAEELLDEIPVLAGGEQLDV
jgi:hypothetical protein